MSSSDIPPTAPLAVSYSRTAELLGCSVFTIRRRVKDGTLPSFSLGGMPRIPIEAIEALIASAR